MYKKVVEFFIKNSQVTIIMILVIVIGGISGWFASPKQYNPSIESPAFTLVFKAPGYTQKEVEDYINKPFGKFFYNLDDVKDITSTASDNYGTFVISFEVNTPKDDARIRVIQKLQEKRGVLPDGVELPAITEMDSEAMPIYGIALYYSGDDKTEDEQKILLRKVALDIKEKLRNNKDYTQFYVIGGENENLNIKADINKLEAKGVDFLALQQVISENNFSFPGGELDSGDNVSSVKINGDIDSVKDLKNLIVGNYNGNLVYLSDVADVTSGVSEHKKDNFVSVNGDLKPTVFLGVAKRKGLNSVTVYQNFKEDLSEIKNYFPKNVEYKEVLNEGINASNATNEMLGNIFSSFVIVIIVLFFYLGFRNAFNVSLSIPFTFGIIFLIVFLTGDNINKMTLVSLIVALGMLVDDSTVVIDNIIKNWKLPENKDKELLPIIKFSVQEVGLGLTFAMITRIVAFSAMFMVTGFMGQFIKPLPTYVIWSMLFSNLLSITLIPFIFYVFNKNKKIKPEKKEDNKLISSYKNYISRIIGTTKEHAKNRTKVMISFFVIMILAFAVPVSLGLIKQASTPKLNQRQLNYFIDIPVKDGINKTLEVTSEFNKLLSCFNVESEVSSDFCKENIGLNKDEIKAQNLNIIKSTTYAIGNAPLLNGVLSTRGAIGRTSENQISGMINLTEKKERTTQSQIFNEIITAKIKSSLIKEYPLIKLKIFDTPGGVPEKGDFVLEVKANTLQSQSSLLSFYHKLEEKMMPVFQEYKLKDVYDDVDDYKTSYEVRLNHELITRLGLSVKQVAMSVKTMLDGNYISFSEDASSLEPKEIFINLDKEDNLGENLFDRLYFTNSSGKKVPLSEIADITKTQNVKKLSNLNGENVVTLTGNTTQGNPISSIAKGFDKAILNPSFLGDNYEVKKLNNREYLVKEKGVDYEFKLTISGQWKTLKDTVGELRSAIGLAFIVIFLIMSLKFGSFSIGLIIMMTFLFGFVGILPGYGVMNIFFGTLFTSLGNLGILSLIGIVTGNAIILLEQMLHYKKVEGLNLEEALKKATGDRIGPIIATNATTILGVMTLMGDVVFSGMAYTMMFGLVASVTLTLLVFPIFVYNIYLKLEKKQKLD